MKSKQKRDKEFRNFFNKTEYIVQQIKGIFKNKLLPSFRKKQCFFLLLLLPSKVRQSKIRNRCVFTSRSRGISKVFKISRFIIREISYRIPRFRKASW